MTLIQEHGGTENQGEGECGESMRSREPLENRRGGLGQGSACLLCRRSQGKYLNP